MINRLAYDASLARNEDLHRQAAAARLAAAVPVARRRNPLKALVHRRHPDVQPLRPAGGAPRIVIPAAERRLDPWRPVSPVSSD
jgi:hypothetical protein